MRPVRTQIALLAAALLPAAAAAQTIDTGAPLGGVNANGFGQLNPSQAILVGQTFTAPAYAQLDRFAFYLGDSRSFTLLGYRAFVAAFDPTTERIVGPLLFQSDRQPGTADFSPTLTTFETGGVAVVPGQLYIAFLGAPEQAGSFTQLGGVAYRTGADAYAGGQARMAVAYPGTVPSILESRFTPLTSDDFAFRASFSTPAQSTVPEPTSVALLGGGLLGTAVVARRRRAAVR